MERVNIYASLANSARSIITKRNAFIATAPTDFADTTTGTSSVLMLIELCLTALSLSLSLSLSL